MKLRDLEPQKDLKAGSPRSSPPGGTKLAEYTEYVQPAPEVHSNGVWRVIACSAISLLAGMIVAWFTALQARGISQKDMQEYVDKFSPYSHDKEVIALQQANQDKEIGSLSGHKDRLFDRVRMIEDKHIEYEGKFSDLYKKMDTVANYLEEEKKVKK